MVIFTGVTSRGVRYSIDDAYMAKPGTEQERRVIEDQRSAAYEILRRAAEREQAQAK